jgi:hypothetical protein
MAAAGMRLTQSHKSLFETYKQEIASCNALMKSAREAQRRTEQPAWKSLSPKVKITATVVHIMSNQNAALTRLFCQTRLMSKHPRMLSPPTSDSYQSLDFLLKNEKIKEKADDALTVPLHNRSYARAAQFIAESKVHDWLLKINTGGNGPSSRAMADFLLENWPQPQRCPTLLDMWRSKLANPKHLSVWASQFRGRWFIKWEAKGHKKHIDLETSCFRAFDPDLAHTLVDFVGDKTSPVFWPCFWPPCRPYMSCRGPFVVTNSDTHFRTPV